MEDMMAIESTILYTNPSLPSFDAIKFHPQHQCLATFVVSAATLEKY